MIQFLVIVVYYQCNTLALLRQALCIITVNLFVKITPSLKQYSLQTRSNFGFICNDLFRFYNAEVVKVEFYHHRTEFGGVGHLYSQLITAPALEFAPGGLIDE